MPTPRVTFSISFTQAEYHAIEIAAKAQGMKVAPFARTCILKRVQINLPPTQRRPLEAWRNETNEDGE